MLQEFLRISATTAGIEIERGSYPDAFFGFDEDLAWNNGGARVGSFVFKDQNDALLGIRTNSVTTGGGNLYLISEGTGGVVTVTGVTDYEKGVFAGSPLIVTDDGSGVTIDDDIIPNTKSVVDYVTYALSTGSVPARLQESDTAIEAHDFSVTGNDSKLQFDINGNTTANLFADRLEAFDIMIQNNEITTTASNTDLVLGSPGTGSVKIKDTLELTETPGENDVATDPSVPSEGIKLYSKTMSNGGSGLFFINKSNKQDELISKNKALVFSMVF